jgi:hypothetical protein
MDRLSLVKSSGGLDLPHQEGACLSPSLHMENEQEKDLFQDDSAPFVLQKRKTTRISS